MEQELLTFPGQPPVISGVSATRSLVLCRCFVDRCLSFCTFSSGHCSVCSSLIYGRILITPLVSSILLPTKRPNFTYVVNQWKGFLKSCYLYKVNILKFVYYSNRKICAYIEKSSWLITYLLVYLLFLFIFAPSCHVYNCVLLNVIFVLYTIPTM